MKISIICAMDEKRGIGKDNKIPWHIKEDLVHLKGLTKDHVVILGRKSYDSMVFYYNKTGRPMPGKLYVVVTHDKNYKPARGNAVVSHSLEEALEIAKQKNIYSSSEAASDAASREVFAGSSRLTSFARTINYDEIFIIGGGQIFQQALPLADKLYLIIVDGDYACDTFFPDYAEFKRVISEKKSQSEKYKYKFLDLER